jgi:hypothetical protein
VRPFVLAIQENVSSKVTGRAVGALHTLIVHDAIELGSAGTVLDALAVVDSGGETGIETQVLQAVVSMAAHLDLQAGAMATALACTIARISHKQQAVAATANATARQLLARLFDRALIADTHLELSRSAAAAAVVAKAAAAAAGADAESGNSGAAASSSDAKTEAAGQTVNDAIAAIRDICRLTSGEEGPWLPLKELAPVTGLELIEAVLRDYQVAFAERALLLALLRDFICPMLVKLFRKEKMPASLIVRHMRIVALVVTHFDERLPNECEVFFTRMVRALESDERRWYRTLVLEVFAMFTDNGQKLESFYRQYGRASDGRAPLFGEFVRALGSLAAQVVHSKPDSKQASHAGAAHGMILLDARQPPRLLDQAQAGGVNLSASGQGDKLTSNSSARTDADLPVTASQMLWFVAENLCGLSAGLALMVDKKGRAADTRAIVVDMLEVSWGSVLAGLSTVMACTENDAVLQTLLKAHQSMIHAAGTLGVETPRDAFLTSLCNFTLGINDGNAVPAAAAAPPPTPAPTGLLAVLTTVVESTTAALSSGGVNAAAAAAAAAEASAAATAATALPLTAAQASGMRALLNVAHCFGSELGSRGWFVLLDAMERLDSRLSKSAAKLRSADDEQRGNELHVLRDALAGVFRSSRSLSRDGLNDLLAALNQLSFPSRFAIASSGSEGSARYSMFAIARMVDTTLENLHRIDQIWDVVAKHLMFVFSHADARIREHGGESLTKIITATFQAQSRAVVVAAAASAATAATSSADSASEAAAVAASAAADAAAEAERKAAAAALALRMQVPLLRVFEQLSESPHADARERSLLCLHQVLSAAGDVLQSDAWRVVLRTLGTIASSRDALTSRGFRNLEFVIRDFLALLSLDCIEPLVDAIGCYAAQEQDLNMSLTAVGLMWDVADNLATRTRADTSLPTTETAQLAPLERLWLVVFEHLQRLGISAIPPLRNSALATLFKSVTMQGSLLTPNTWNSCLRDVLFPLLVQVKTAASMAASEPANLDGTRAKPVELPRAAQAMMMHHSRSTVEKQWDETIVVAIDGVADACRRFFGKINHLAELRAHWTVLLDTLSAFALQPAEEVSVAAVRNAFNVLLLHAPLAAEAITMPRELWDAAWRSCASVCFLLTSKPQQTSPVTVGAMVERLEQVVQSNYATFTLDDHAILHDMLHALALFPAVSADLRGGRPSAAQAAVVAMIRATPPLSADAFEVLLRRTVDLLHKALDALPPALPADSDVPDEVPATLPLAALCCDAVAHLFERRASDGIRANHFAAAVRVASLAASMRQRFRCASPVDAASAPAAPPAVMADGTVAPRRPNAASASAIARFHALASLWQHGSSALLRVLTSGLPAVHTVVTADSSRRLQLTEAWTEALDATEACVIAAGHAERVVLDDADEDGSSADEVSVLSFLVEELSVRAESLKLIPERLLDLLIDGAGMRGRRAVPKHCDALLFRLCSAEHAGAGGVSERLSQLAESYAMRRVRSAIAAYGELPADSDADARKHASVQVCSVLRHLAQLRSPLFRGASADAHRLPKLLLRDIAPLALARDDNVRAALHQFLLFLGDTLTK